MKVWPWALAESDRAGETLPRLEVGAETVAASLQWATVPVSKGKRNDSRVEAPVAAG